TGALPADPAAAGGSMTSMRVSVMVAMLLALSARQGAASPGSPWNSTVPKHITLVRSRAGVPDGTGNFTVIVHDLANNPLNNRPVDIDLSGCADLVLCSDQLDPAATVDCAAKRVRKFTDITGHVAFTVLGGSNGLNHASTLQGG